jgi:hypothetical protein
LVLAFKVTYFMPFGILTIDALKPRESEEGRIDEE